jgi:hypothetical protein
MVREVRSPWSLDRDDPHPRRAESPGSRSSPSNAARADGGHIANNLGKGGHRPVSARRDSGQPVLGSGFQSPLDPRDPTAGVTNDSRRR